MFKIRDGDIFSMLSSVECFEEQGSLTPSPSTGENALPSDECWMLMKSQLKISLHAGVDYVM